jgi:hypothetical protein
MLDLERMNRLTGVLALIVTLGFLALLGYLAAYRPDQRDLLNVMIGALATAWVSIVSYYFGSSRGSDDKTNLLTAKKEKE